MTKFVTINQVMKPIAPFDGKIEPTITSDERENYARESAERLLGSAYQEVDRKAAEEKFNLTLEAYIESARAIFEDLEVRVETVSVAPDPKGDPRTGVEKKFPPYKKEFTQNPELREKSTEYQLFLRTGNVLTEHTGFLGVDLFETATKGNLKNPYSKQIDSLD